MKAAMRDRYGPPEVVEIRDVERPTPAKDELLVRVRAASVNRADLDNLYPRWQFVRLFLGLRRPRNRRLGADVAGVVEAVRPNVTSFKPGDEVFADPYEFGMGAFAEYVCAPEKAFATMPLECRSKTLRLFRIRPSSRSRASVSGEDGRSGLGIRF